LHWFQGQQRLANLAQQRNEDFGLLLTKYALERLLFRISQSEYQKIFVLKGALLFELWTEQAHRPTRDADFLSNGDNDPSRFESIFKEICALPVDEDGLQFDQASVKAQRIEEGERRGASREGGPARRCHQAIWLAER
jgi:hypothetical protein